MDFYKWVKELFNNAARLINLDINLFSDAEFDFEATLTQNNISQSANNQNSRNHKENPDLALWRKYKPLEIKSENLKIPILSELDYIGFLYEKLRLFVLAPTNANEAYFYFEYKNSYEETIKKLAPLKTRDDIAKHIIRCKHTDNIKNRIDNLFKSIENKAK